MGKIFSIEEMTVFDGPGVRMSIFLKGCPLRCVWCHSPEGQRSESEMIRALSGCLQCGNCLIGGKLLPESAARCPKGLVRECGGEFTAEEVSRRVEELGALLDGVTFSGGEPLMQGPFLLECLQALEGKIHRAVQTCGYADVETFAQILQHVELVLMDLKLMDPTDHRRFTGVDNAPILANFCRLAQSGVPFITRVPLIPGITDGVENLTAIACFLKENGVSYVELLPYNTMAGAKYAALGRRWKPPYDETVPCNPHGEIWENYGIEVKIL